VDRARVALGYALVLLGGTLVIQVLLRVALRTVGAAGD
jgi:hypothetical protein